MYVGSSVLCFYIYPGVCPILSTESYLMYAVCQNKSMKVERNIFYSLVYFACIIRSYCCTLFSVVRNLLKPKGTYCCERKVLQYVLQNLTEFKSIAICIAICIAIFKSIAICIAKSQR